VNGVKRPCDEMVKIKRRRRLGFKLTFQSTVEFLADLLGMSVEVYNLYTVQHVVVERLF
jgi:hypothetical protein